MQRLLPPFAFLISLLLMLALHLWAPGGLLIASPYNLAGVVPVAAGVAAALWGSRKFERVGTNIRTFNDPDKLVTGGLFRYTRNPMYLGLALALLGFAVLMGSLTPFFVAAAFIVLTDRWYIRFEERKLSEKFGADYQSYRARVRRWL